MTQEMKPCPFCGGEQIGWAVVDTVCVVGCDACNASMEETANTGDEAKTKAEAAWNRRQPVARTPLSDDKEEQAWM